jgi:hypothetical protein
MNPEPETRSSAYWYGWQDGRHEEPRRFTENPRLAEFDAPHERLDYYQGHRAGLESRRSSLDLLEAS